MLSDVKKKKKIQTHLFLGKYPLGEIVKQSSCVCEHQPPRDVYIGSLPPSLSLSLSPSLSDTLAVYVCLKLSSLLLWNSSIPFQHSWEIHKEDEGQTQIRACKHSPCRNSVHPGKAKQTTVWFLHLKIKESKVSECDREENGVQKQWGDPSRQNPFVLSWMKLPWWLNGSTLRLCMLQSQIQFPDFTTIHNYEQFSGFSTKYNII